jgi:hypothetical protein
MKKQIVSVMMALAFLFSVSAMAQTTAPAKDGKKEAKKECCDKKDKKECCKKDGKKECCKKKEGKEGKKECCKKTEAAKDTKK